MVLEHLLRPKSIAVVGASPNSFVGSISLINSKQLGYKGGLHPVSTRSPEVAGLAAVASLHELDEVPDLVLVQVKTSTVLPVVRDALTLGVRNFVIPGGGITDSGPDAIALDAGLRQLRRDTDFNVVGPNSMGVLDLVSGAAPYVGTVPSHIRPGTVGVVAQSGAVVELVVNAGGRVPVSTLVSTGTESATGMAQYLDFFKDDPHTNAVLAFIEGFENPQEVLNAARRFVAGGKLLAATFAGRSSVSREGISAHSGKLAPNARVTAAALAQVGVHLAEDLDELLTFGEIFGAGNIPKGNRVHFVTNSGGEGNLLADLAEDAGLELPAMSSNAIEALKGPWPLFTVRNPLDPWGVDAYERIYPIAVKTAAAESGDILIVSQDQQQTSGEHEQGLGLDLARYLNDAAHDAVVPILLSPTSQDPHHDITEYCRREGITHLRGARPALRALGKLASPRGVDGIATDLEPCHHFLMGKRHPLTEDESLQVLSSLGVSVPAQARAASPVEAGRAAMGLRHPVVVKGVAEDLWHKSELGLVAVGLSGEEAVREAAAGVLTNAKSAGVEVDLLVAEMARGDLDAYVGYKRDSQFGDTLVLGLGGIWTEELDSVDIFVGLLDSDLAHRWLPTTRVGRMLAAARGGAISPDGVIAALVAVSRLAHTYKDVVAVDINPVMVSHAGSIAVDASIQRSADLAPN